MTQHIAWTKTLTVRVGNDYWRKDKDSRYRFIEEYRHMFGVSPVTYKYEHTPKWAIEIELYALGFFSPNYPVPAIRQHFEWVRGCITGKVRLVHFWYGAYDG